MSLGCELLGFVCKVELFSRVAGDLCKWGEGRVFSILTA